MDIKDFAEHYTAAWCSHDPLRVAECYSEQGSLAINGGAPSVGRAAVAADARGFMDDFPDLSLRCDGVQEQDGRIVYRWTLEGTHARTRKRVSISGQESWRIGVDGLIAESRGSFDQQDYDRQVGG